MAGSLVAAIQISWIMVQITRKTMGNSMGSGVNILIAYCCYLDGLQLTIAFKI
jgi:hypothetical protein